MNFDDAFTRLLGNEGGYSNDPRDPGGETMWGITRTVATANGYTGNMAHLDQGTAKAIYRKLYWDAVRADDLPAAVRFSVFDAAVNSGVKQAVKWLQEAVGTADDGVIGPATLTAAAGMDGPTAKAIYNGARLDFMAQLPTWPAFGRGWARRVARILKDPLA